MTTRLATKTDASYWNDFVFSSAYPSFLQSWEWGEMQRILGTRFWRLVVETGGTWQAVALVIERKMQLGKSWLYLPRGPVLAERGSFTADQLLGQSLLSPPWQALQEKIMGIAQAERMVFVRIDPAIPKIGFGKETILDRRWRKSEREVQPRHTLKLDLKLSDDELLQHMHTKTRYNIRLATKKGVAVRFSHEERDTEMFLHLASKVMERTSFRYHPAEYYQAMVAALAPQGMLDIAVAEWQHLPLAVHIVVFAGQEATYVHGASSTRDRHLMAPHLLHWEEIRRARRRGCWQFDLFGVAPQPASLIHPWAGVTRFKEGFGGQREEYIGAYDQVLDQVWYWAYMLAHRLKK